MIQLIDIVLFTIPICGAIQLLLLVDNLAVFSKDTQILEHKPLDQENTELVSVLIPARDEEANIARCLNSIFEQSYKNLEVIVLDDESTDSTKSIVEDLFKNKSSCSLLDGAPTPQGYTGKNFACKQLKENAKGDWLLFLDADTHLEKDAIASAVEIAKEKEAALVCLWPRQEMVSNAEKLMIPLLSFILLGFLPLRFAEWTNWHIFTAANGQFMLFAKELYEKSGGHESLKDEIMDDVRLAQMIKQANGKVVIRDAGRLVQCRMYDSFNSIWLGFRKNIYAAFNGKFLIFALSIFALFLGHSAPPILAIAGFYLGLTSLYQAMAIQTVIGILMRLILAIKLNQPFLSAMLHQVAVSITVALAIDSFIGYNGQGVLWKGRTYKRTR